MYKHSLIYQGASFNFYESIERATTLFRTVGRERHVHALANFVSHRLVVRKKVFNRANQHYREQFEGKVGSCKK